MSYYYNTSPFAVNVPLPPSPYSFPYGSPYGVHIALPPSPVSYAVSVPLPPSPVPHSAPLTPIHNPIPLPLSGSITPTRIATSTSFKAHPLLTFDAQDPALRWDVRFPPPSARIDEPPFPAVSRGHLGEPAVSPPWTFVRLRTPLLPWLVEVSNPRGVNVGDILSAVYSCLRHRVEKDEWRDQTREFQSRLLDAWRERYTLVGREEGGAAREREQDRGVRRVDWLLYDTEWLGIERSKTELETWDLHFRSL